MVWTAWRRLGVLSLVGLAVLSSSPALASVNGTRISSFSYDAGSGLLTQEVVEPNTAALRVTTAYTYDSFGNRTAATVSGVDIATRTSSTGYDPKGRFATSVTNALNQSESWTYDPKFGVPLSQTGPNGLTTSWTYDSFGRKTLETRSDGTKTAFAYAYCSGVNGGTATCPTYGAYVVTVTPLAADGVTQNGPIARTCYDQMGRAIASDTQGFDGAVIRMATQYDALGRIWKASRPYFLSGGMPKWITNTYDAIGRVTQTTMPDGSKAIYAYHGLTTSITNDKNQTRITVKNAQGLIASVTDAIGKVTAYAYDPFGNLLVTTDSAGNVITAAYDAAGRKIAMSDPDMGAWSYTYDVLGQIKTQTDAKGQVTTLSYDLLGRITQRVEPGLTSNWTYDTAPMGVGKPAGATTNAGYSRSHFYDGQGRPSQTSITILGDTSNVSTYYNADGRMSMVAYPSGFMVEYVYNARGYLAQIKDPNASQVYWTANAYDAEMSLTQQTAGNGVITSQGYDPNTSFLTSIQAGPSESPSSAANFAYSYDTIGNLQTRVDANTSLTESFQYDTLNRITQYAIASGSTKTVTYDDLGNIISKSDVGIYSYNASGASSVRPHAVAAIVPSGSGTVNTTYTYDANGNMLTGNGRTTSWTSFNMVASITQGTKAVGFDYDGEHARIRQVTSSATTLYINAPASGIRVEKVTGSGGTVQWNEYLFAGGRMIGEHFTNISGTSSTMATRYFVTDHLGSISVITDESGNVVERLSYDAWGKRRFPTGADDPAGSITSQTTRGFTGHEMIDDIGLVNMNGRIYDPQIGRFMSADPIIQDIGDSQALNRYSYVRNNPLNLVDPTGFSWLSKIFNSIVSFVRDVFRAIGSLLSNPRALISLAVGAALSFILLPELGLMAGDLINAGISGGAAGAIATGNLKGALIGAGTAMAFVQVGTLKEAWKASRLEGALMHGAVGGASSAANGGNFGSGFLAAGMSELAGPNIRQVFGESFGGKLAAHATIGGIGSKLGGGKFENGFTTAAFGYLFNYCMHDGRCFTTASEDAYLNRGDYAGYYKAACGGGDGYACQAGDIAGGKTLPAMVTTARLTVFAADAGVVMTPEALNKIRLSLARGYADYLGNSADTAKVPSAMSIAKLHWDVFGTYGIPPRAFGGTPLGTMTPGGTWYTKQYPAFIGGGTGWCPTCAP